METENLILNQILKMIRGGGIQEALEFLQKKLETDPNNYENHYLIVLVLIHLNRFKEARKYARQAVELFPKNALLRAHLAFILLSLKLFAEAALESLRALQLNPNQIKVYACLGHALLELRRYNDALEWLLKAEQHFPDDVQIQYDLGRVYISLGQLEKAEAKCYRTIEINPQSSNAWTNLGRAFQYQNRYRESIECFSKAIDLNSKNSHARMDRALMYLLMGNYELGWSDYEYRLQLEKWTKYSFTGTLWDGKLFTGKKLLIFAEQGLGDTIQFIRYTPLVKKLGGEVIVECKPQLLHWLEKYPGIDVLIASGTTRPAYDYYVYHMSLPYLFGTTLETIPPSIIPPTHQRLQGKQRNKVLSVGIVWAGSPNYADDSRRSCPFEYFKNLATVQGIRLVSLQKGNDPELLASSNIENGVENCEDFADTAKVIENLDLVISVDTAVAHLSGTLGKPTWVVLGYVHDWRWLIERQDSPWYSNIRLFRQRNYGEWEEVFSQIRDALVTSVQQMP